MTEEQTTKAILNFLISNNWEVVCFDFPQSGTGRMLHPNDNNSEKNKDSIVPDIVAVRKKVCVFFENKDRFYLPDFEKQNSLKTGNDYSKAISDLLQDYDVEKIFYGIGLPTIKYKKAAIAAAQLVDFIICVNEDKSIQVCYNPLEIVFD